MAEAVFFLLEIILAIHVHVSSSQQIFHLLAT